MPDGRESVFKFVWFLLWNMFGGQILLGSLIMIVIGYFVVGDCIRSSRIRRDLEAVGEATRLCAERCRDEHGASWGLCSGPECFCCHNRFESQDGYCAGTSRRYRYPASSPENDITCPWVD